MKVVAINGSPKAAGNTYDFISVVGKELEKEGIELEIIHVGNKTIRGCLGCNHCIKMQNEKCIIEDDVNDIIQKMKAADGIILGSPTYYSGVNGTMKSFLDRVFYVAGVNGSLFRHKIGASLVAVRRSGGIPAFNELNHYITFSEMFMPTSNYWNVIYGRVPGETVQDLEGQQIARTLGRNMAWLLKCVALGKETLNMPEYEQKILTNFVR